MKEWIILHRLGFSLGVFLVSIFAVSAFFFPQEKKESAPPEKEIVFFSDSNNRHEKISGSSQKTAFEDSISKSIPEVSLQHGKLRQQTVDIASEKKTNNGMHDAFNGFSEKIESLLSPEYSESKYYAANSNPKNIKGLYFTKYIEGVPTLFRLPPGGDEVVEMDLNMPPNSAKHKMLSDKIFGYVSDIDIEQIGKTLSLINMESGDTQKIPVSNEEMRIASFFASPDGKKVVVGEEYPPTTGENFATSDTLHHRVWVHDTESADKKWLIFDQKEDIIERWPIFWAAEDNKVYFNSCDVKDMYCNFGITRTSSEKDEREQVPGLEVGTYASQPILSNNGRHMAFVAWNGNTDTPLYKEGEKKNNEFLNKNAIWIYDIREGSKRVLVDFGANRVIDHLTWAPDGVTLVFELRQLVTLKGEKTPTSNSAGIWYINAVTGKFARISPDTTISPGQLLSHFTPTPDGSGISFSVTKLFPITTFIDKTRTTERTEFFLRFSDMRLFELGNDISGVMKSESL